MHFLGGNSGGDSGDSGGFFAGVKALFSGRVAHAFFKRGDSCLYRRARDIEKRSFFFLVSAAQAILKRRFKPWRENLSLPISMYFSSQIPSLLLW